MKKYLILFAFVLFSKINFAQYTGGAGDGYASCKLQTTVMNTSNFEKNENWQLVKSDLKNRTIILKNKENYSGEIQLTICDINGKIIPSKSLKNKKEIIWNFSENISSGIYILKLKTQKEQVAFKVEMI